MCNCDTNNNNLMGLGLDSDKKHLVDSAVEVGIAVWMVKAGYDWYMAVMMGLMSAMVIPPITARLVG